MLNRSLSVPVCLPSFEGFPLRRRSVASADKHPLSLSLARPCLLCPMCIVRKGFTKRNIAVWRFHANLPSNLFSFQARLYPHAFCHLSGRLSPHILPGFFLRLCRSWLTYCGVVLSNTSRESRSISNYLALPSNENGLAFSNPLSNHS